MRASRKNITQPTDWWAAFVRQAQEEDITLSEWIGACCMMNLPASISNRLTDRAPANRPKKSNNKES